MTGHYERKLQDQENLLDDKLDGFERSIIKEVKSSLGAHFTEVETAIMEIQSGRHPYQYQIIADLRESNAKLTAALQKRREKEFKQDELPPNTSLAWPQHLDIFSERSKYENIFNALACLHSNCGTTNALRLRLQAEIEDALRSGKSKRYLLNHLAYFPDKPEAKAIID